MICPNCSKTYFNGRVTCPFCGFAAERAGGAEAGDSAPAKVPVWRPPAAGQQTRAARPPVPEPVRREPVQTQDAARRTVNAYPRQTGTAQQYRRSAAVREPSARGPIAAPPRRPAGTVSNPSVRYSDRASGGAKRSAGKRKKSGVGVVILWIAVAAVIFTVLMLYLSGTFEKKDDTAIGREFIEKLILGDVDKALKMMPFDPEKVYHDSLKAELDGAFGGSYEDFIEKYKLMGVSAPDFESFVTAAYSKIASEFKIGFVALSGGKYTVGTEAVNVKAYSESELGAYRSDLSRYFTQAGLNAADYLDPASIEAVDDVRYKVTVISPDGVSQQSEVLLTLVTVDGLRYVMPENSRLYASRTGVAGTWTFTEGGQTVSVTFNTNGRGEVASDGKSIPLTYRLVGADGLKITCDAFGEGETVCTYSISNGTLTLTLPDGIMEMKKTG